MKYILILVPGLANVGLPIGYGNAPPPIAPPRCLERFWEKVSKDIFELDYYSAFNHGALTHHPPINVPKTMRGSIRDPHDCSFCIEEE